MRGFLWDPPGSLHITTLHGSLILLGGLTPPDPPLFRTLHASVVMCVCVCVCVCVSAEPTSLTLSVDGLPIKKDNTSIEYNNITHVDIMCVATGGYPEPIVTIRTNSVDLEPSSVHALCRPQSSDLPPFLPNLTCSATIVVQQYLVDFISSGTPVMCTARSRGSPDARLSTSFVPRFTNGTFNPSNISVIMIVIIIRQVSKIALHSDAI